MKTDKDAPVTSGQVARTFRSGADSLESRRISLAFELLPTEIDLFLSEIVALFSQTKLVSMKTGAISSNLRRSCSRCIDSVGASG